MGVCACVVFSSACLGKVLVSIHNVIELDTVYICTYTLGNNIYMLVLL